MPSKKSRREEIRFNNAQGGRQYDNDGKYVSGKKKVDKKKSSKDKKTFNLGPTQDLSAERKQRIGDAKSIRDVKDINVKGPEFGRTKREIFAEEKPIQKKILDVASATAFYGAVGVAGQAGAALATGKAATQAAIQSANAQQIVAQGGTAVSKANVVGTAKSLASSLTKGFGTNAKTNGLTLSFAAKAGLTLAAASTFIGVVGSYPFAGFIKEEALQTLGFSVRTARESGDMEGEQAAIDQNNELLNPTAWDKILGAIPFANVLKNLKSFYEAAATKNAADQESLDRRRATVGQTSEFEQDRIAAEESANQRKLDQQDLDAQYYGLIREGKFEEANELLQSRREE